VAIPGAAAEAPAGVVFDPPGKREGSSGGFVKPGPLFLSNDADATPVGASIVGAYVIIGRFKFPKNMGFVWTSPVMEAYCGKHQTPSMGKYKEHCGRHQNYSSATWALCGRHQNDSSATWALCGRHQNYSSAIGHLSRLGKPEIVLAPAQNLKF
jgi:hypothetical protein